MFRRVPANCFLKRRCTHTIQSRQAADSLSSLHSAIFGGSAKEDVLAPSGAESPLSELLAAARRGRMDRALKLAKPLAEEAGRGETASAFVARECSERAALAFQDSAAERERAVALSVSGASFKIPGRAHVRPAELLEGFWLREVSDQHERADAIAKLARASLALRGLEEEDAVSMLQDKADSGDSGATADVAAAARDYRLIAETAPIWLQTGRCYAVLHAYVGRTFAADQANMGRYPKLLTLLLNAGRHFSDDCKRGTGGSFEEVTAGNAPLLLPLRRQAESKKIAVNRQLRFISEIVAEASLSMLTERDDGLGLINVAEAFFQADCPPEARRPALQVFRATAERLQLR